MEPLKILREALEAARRSIENREDLSRPVRQGSFGDISTVADIESERAIIDTIQRQILRAAILSEEAGLLGDPDRSDYIFIVDPIDGTVNLTTSIPFYSSAIAIANGTKFKDIFAAGVINLVNGDLILADEDGVTLSGKRVFPSKNTSISNAIVSIDSKVFKEGGVFSKLAEKVLSDAKYVRSMGSAALETAYVACGFLDCFLGLKGIRAVDMVASAFIVEKAGGCVEWLEGRLQELDILDRCEVRYVSAANKKLMEELISIVNY